MSDLRILTVQDISCVGQCSLTVALPILSACGLETGVLPSAVLSTHTGGFTGYTFRDLTEDMPRIVAHWQKEHIAFDAIYTGYLGSTRQIDCVRQLMQTVARPGCRRIVDPAMADNGKLYPGFDEAFVKQMAGLCAEADVILPNLTEACLITGLPYREVYDEAYSQNVLAALRQLTPATVVLTGIGYRPAHTGVLVCEGDTVTYYEHRRVAQGCHGTGDVYAAAFVGALMRGRDVATAARLAADYTVRCIEATVPDKEHWYGVKFEKELPWLIRALGD